MSLPTTEPWSRRRLAWLLAGAAAVGAVLLTGLVYMLVSLLAPAATDEPSVTKRVDLLREDSGDVRGDEYRDALAAEPMMSTRESDLSPQPPAAEQAEVLEAPTSTATGDVDIATGFPHTPEGAVAQLMEISQRVVTSMSLEHARLVWESWAADPEGFESWGLTEAIGSFHQAAGTVENDPTVSVRVIPAGGQIKGTDGPGWVLSCVHLDVTISVARQTRFGYGHCDRMQWTGERWIIAAGEPPAVAPSTWPGSERSVEAGWLRWGSGEH